MKGQIMQLYLKLEDCRPLRIVQFLYINMYFTQCGPLANELISLGLDVKPVFL